jgi:hypothetical protein
MAYYYCDFQEGRKRDCDGLLSSLLSQLSAESDACYRVLAQLHSKHASGAQKPTSSALTECVKEMLSLPGQGQVYILIDAIDECPTSGTPSAREEVLELVGGLVHLHLPNVHLCVTSRPEVDIQRVFEPLDSLRMSLHEEGGQKNDIIHYIKSFLHSDGNMRQWSEEDQQLVIDALSEKADGMSVTFFLSPYQAFHRVLTHSHRFQYVACQTASLFS